MRAYEECLSATSTRNSPWYDIPADDKENARLIIPEVILDTFRSLDLACPGPGEEHRRELRLVREQLAG